jgi:glycosyltransferase involved in cell wall biosynthesis
MIKLLYITNGITGAGGLERVLSIKASYLAENYNYEVHILTLNEIGRDSFYEFSPQVVLHSIQAGGNPINYFKEYRTGIKRIIKQVRPDVLSVCDDGLKGFFLPLLLGKPFPMIYERHVSKEIEMRHDLSLFKRIVIQAKWKVMEYLASDFNKFVVLTEGNTNEWSTLRNLEVISNPLSFYPQNSSALDHNKVIVVGRQAYQKGYDLLLLAWKKVIDERPDWQLEIYGKKDVNQNLESLADALGITKNVSFLNPEKNIEQKYLESSIYVMSSRFEGFGMVLIESMACGVPCVSFDCNYGPSDIIQNGVDGYLVENGNIGALASTILKLIEDENLRKVMGSKAKENVKRYLPNIIVKQWDQLFVGLVQ